MPLKLAVICCGEYANDLNDVHVRLEECWDEDEDKA